MFLAKPFTIQTSRKFLPKFFSWCYMVDSYVGNVSICYNNHQTCFLSMSAGKPFTPKQDTELYRIVVFLGIHWETGVLSLIINNRTVQMYLKQLHSLLEASTLTWQKHNITAAFQWKIFQTKPHAGAYTKCATNVNHYVCTLEQRSLFILKQPQQASPYSPT